VALVLLATGARRRDAVPLAGGCLERSRPGEADPTLALITLVTGLIDPFWATSGWSPNSILRRTVRISSQIYIRAADLIGIVLGLTVVLRFRLHPDDVPPGTGGCRAGASLPSGWPPTRIDSELRSPGFSAGAAIYSRRSSAPASPSSRRRRRLAASIIIAPSFYAPGTALASVVTNVLQRFRHHRRVRLVGAHRAAGRRAPSRDHHRRDDAGGPICAASSRWRPLRATATPIGLTFGSPRRPCSFFTASAYQNPPSAPRSVGRSSFSPASS
jgi:hypothetical protein